MASNAVVRRIIASSTTVVKNTSSRLYTSEKSSWQWAQRRCYAVVGPRSPSDSNTGTRSKQSELDVDEMIPKGLPSREGFFAATGIEEVGEEDATEAEELAPHEDADPDALMNVLDPLPGKRLRWQRRQIVKHLRNRGVLTKAEIIKQTERECELKSRPFKTSTKKLMHLARQVAGKSIDEAIVQMRFSKKRVAQDILKHLEHAKNVAVVKYGMGMGTTKDQQSTPVEIELKDGKRRRIEDRTCIYIEQAWVNKGQETSTPEFRGRGRVFTLTHRTASLTIRLKEEITRLREAQERQEKHDNRKPWLHLPDRPVTLQRQYPLW